MQYHQKQYPFYNPELIRMSMGSSDFTVNYVELLDESCVEFRHVHDDSYEIYYCLEGTQNFWAGNERLTLTGGMFLLLAPGVHHYTIYEPQIPKRYAVFVFSLSAATASRGKCRCAEAEDDFVTEALSQLEGRGYFIGKEQFGSRAVLSTLHQEIVHPSAGHSLMVNALYQQYLITILRCILGGAAQPQQPEPAKINLSIAITKYMHANYHKNISVQDIADTFYISPRHVNRVFEDYFGQSFKRTLNIYRLNYAKNYLLDTDYSTEKIAALVGLSSPKMLYQLFREIEGMTLGEFRAQYGKRSTEK